MDGRQLTQFEHILLGLICLSPASGYDLKRIFAVTPMGLYQPSSGSLYPALRRLERDDLIQAQAPASQSARRRRVYEPTKTGQAAHLDWLRTPVDPATAPRDLGLHLMRFVMMEHQLTREEVLAFLRSLSGALAALVTQLERYAAAPSAPSPGGHHPRLALDHGLAVHRASLHWAEQTIAALSAAHASAQAGPQ